MYIIRGFCLDSDRYAYRATESLFLPIRHDITVAIGIGIDVYNKVVTSTNVRQSKGKKRSKYGDGESVLRMAIDPLR